MSNGWAAGCKIFAWIALAAGVISGFIVGERIGIWWPFFVSSGSGLVTFLLFGTLGYIADNVGNGGGIYVSSSRPKWMNDQLQDESSKPFKLDEKSISSFSSSKSKKAQSSQKGFWTCPDCGLSNPNYCGTCSCGAKQPK